MGQKRLRALLTHFFYPLRQSRQSFTLPSQALPRQLSPWESQGLKSVAKVLGAMRKLPVVLLPLPLGEVASRSDDGEGHVDFRAAAPPPHDCFRVETSAAAAVCLHDPSCENSVCRTPQSATNAKL